MARLYRIYLRKIDLRRLRFLGTRLASALGTNRTYIANAIKKCTGLAVNEYVNMLRLEYARGLLVERPEDSITLISEEAGFGSVRNFNRLFVAKYAVSPTEYRNNN